MHSSNYQFNLIHCEHAIIHCVCFATKGNAMRTEAINVFHFFPHFDLMKRFIQFVKFECEWRLTVDELSKSNHLFHYRPAQPQLQPAQPQYLMICCQYHAFMRNYSLFRSECSHNWSLITSSSSSSSTSNTYSVRHMCKFDKYVQIFKNRKEKTNVLDIL